MSSITNSSATYNTQYLNASQRMAAGVLGMDTNKLNESLSAVSQKYASLKTQSASSSSSGSISTVISSEGQNLNKVYEQVKSTGNKEAIEGFRKAVVNFTKNGDASGLKTFIDTGVKMNSDKNGAAFSDMLAVSNNISKQASTKAADTFIKEAAATYSQSGVESMKAYSEAANSISAKFETKSTADMSAKSTALSNLNATFSAVQGQDISESKIQSQLADISANVKKQTDLTSVNQYLGTQYKNITGGVLSTAGKSAV
ncbi:MAG TPA: hypothetical protein PKK26_04730 [Candidatus Wallbacteria bacterium]|nr:hypothetical protein [Candidatus Wallbacteria bacterium]